MTKKKVDVLVIVPPRQPQIKHMICKSYPGYPPVDEVPLRVAAMLEKGGFSTEFLPLYNIYWQFHPEAEFDEIVEICKSYNFSAALFINDYYIADRSATAYHYSLKLAHAVREFAPNAKIVLSGRHVTALGQKVFSDSCDIDVVVIGECEGITCALLRKLLSGESMHDLKGIVYLEKGEVLQNGSYALVEDLDDLPVPAYHLLKPHVATIIENTKRLGNKIELSLRSSRGCIFSCAFCGGVPQWNCYRMRSAAKLGEDIDYAQTILGDTASLAYLDDENFAVNKKHVREVADILEYRGIQLDMVLVSVPSFDAAVARELARVCTTVAFGAENCCDEVLRNVNKKPIFSDTMNAVKVAKEAGLSVNLYWIVGLPEENCEIALLNLRKMYELLVTRQVDNISIAMFSPFPGCAITEDPEKYQVQLIHPDWKWVDEKGFYPAYRTRDLSQGQILTYYLLAQITIKDAKTFGHLYDNKNCTPIVSEGSLEQFKEFMQLLGS